MILLNLKDVTKLLSMSKAIEILKEVYLNNMESTSVTPDRIAININNNSEVIFMPGYSKDFDSLGVKIATLYTENKTKQIPTVQGKILIINTNSGGIEAMIDAKSVTAIRTAAMTGVVTDYLSDRAAKTVGVIGSGVQARSQLEAICSV